MPSRSSNTSKLVTFVKESPFNVTFSILGSVQKYPKSNGTKFDFHKPKYILTPR